MTRKKRRGKIDKKGDYVDATNLNHFVYGFNVVPK